MHYQNHPIIGVWEVNAPDAPFAWHMMAFTPFGTIQQSNPPAGNQSESDSSGMGVWRLGQDGTTIEAKFVEYKASHQTGEYIGKGVITLHIDVSGDSFSGSSEACSYDTAGQLSAGPFASPMSGTRVIIEA